MMFIIFDKHEVNSFWGRLYTDNHKGVKKHTVITSIFMIIKFKHSWIKMTGFIRHGKL